MNGKKRKSSKKSFIRVTARRAGAAAKGARDNY
jgi:hypothetical protein